MTQFLLIVLALAVIVYCFKYPKLFWALIIGGAIYFWIVSDGDFSFKLILESIQTNPNVYIYIFLGLLILIGFKHPKTYIFLAIVALIYFGVQYPVVFVIAVIVILVLWGFAEPKVFIFLIIAGLIYFFTTGMKSCNERPIARISDLSVGYLTESAYNNGDYNEESITDRAVFNDGEPQYMVIDFTIKSLADHEVNQTVKFSARTSGTVMNIMIQEAPTGKVESFVGEDGSRTYDLFYTVPAEKGDKKTVRMILKLVSEDEGKTAFNILLTGGDEAAVRGRTSKKMTIRVN